MWNLDRMDQRELPLDGRFTYGTAATPGTGKGATIYVVDSGIRPTHQEFRTQDGTRSRALFGEAGEGGGGQGGWAWSSRDRQGHGH